MIFTLFKLALRNIQKTPLYSFIKVSGLTVGITAILFIGLYLHRELNYDTVHQNADRIVRVVMEYGSRDGDIRKSESTGNKVAPTFKSDFPEIEEAVRVISYEQVVQIGDKSFYEDIYYADSSVFSVFTLPLLQGDSATAIAAPGQIVISTAMAEKYFGRADPLGHELRIDNKSYTVSGVMEKPVENTQLRPQLIAGFLNLRDAAAERETWWSANYATYFLMRQPQDIAALQAKIPAYMESHYHDERYFDENTHLVYHLEPLREVHLYSDVPGNFEANGDIRYLYILLGVGLLILLIATTTYINLTTATGTARIREISMQKVLGAERRHLIAQHLSEAALITGLAVAAGYALAHLMMPSFNSLFDQSLSRTLLMHPVAIASVVLFGALIALLAGAYPAFILSRYRVTALWRGQSQQKRGVPKLRQVLIVSQFAIAVFLIICTLALQQQLNFIQQKNLGFDKEQVIVLPTDAQIIEKVDVIKSEWLRNDLARSVSLSYETPVDINGTYGISKSSDRNDSQNVKALPADEDLLGTMNIRLVAGESFKKEDIDRLNQEEQPAPMPVLINEKQSHAFDWSAEEAVGKIVYFQGNRVHIKGVVGDFHFASLHHPIDRLVIFPSNWGRVLLVKLAEGDAETKLQALQQSWERLAPHRPFRHHFLDDEFAQMYEAEHRTTRLITAFSGLAVLLACLGLFGLASYNIVRRTKEIGIRKVLGASVAGIVVLLSRDFIKLVLIGVIIATPIAWWVIRQWLQDFTYHISLDVTIFVIAAGVAVLIAFLAVGWQSIRASLHDPVRSLRTE